MNLFPFTAVEIAELLDLDLPKKHHSNGVSINYVCPVCGKSKFNLNIQKQVFHCPVCDFGGGMLDVYRTIRNLSSNGAAYKEIMERLNRTDLTKEYKTRSYDKKSEKSHSAAKASREILDKTYRKLLSLCSISSKHLLNLKNRGFSKEEIKKACFKSVPVLNSQNIVQKLIDSNCRLKGVPGFYYNKELGRWEMAINKNSVGYFVPYVDIDGYMTGLQIRRDTKNKKYRYIWFTSAYMNLGASSGTPIHYIKKKESNVLYLTEGGLKAAIAAQLSNKNFIAVAGVNSQEQLDKSLILLKNRGLNTLVDCFDADCISNQYVEKARRTIESKCEKLNIQYKRLNWNVECGKGIDDLLLNIKKGKVTRENFNQRQH